MPETLIRYRMDRLEEGLRRLRRTTIWTSVLFLVAAVLGVSVQLDNRDWIMVGLWVALIVAWLVAMARRLISPQYRVPESAVAMVFDEAGATFHPVGRPMLQASWDSFTLEARWAPQRILFVRRGRTKLRLRLEWLEATEAAISAAVARHSHGRVELTWA